MKKIIPIVLSVIVFGVAYLFLTGRKTEKTDIVVAAYDLPAGHKLTVDDVLLVETDAERVPEGAYTDPQMVVDKVLRIARTPGDLITAAHLGGQQIELAIDERAIAVQVTDSSGLAGLLKPGDQVGLTAVMRMGSQGAYAKMITEGLRVLYVSPEFRSIDPAAYQSNFNGNDGGFDGTGTTPRRDAQGVVVLAVPVDAVVVSYDFAPFGVESETRTINVIDLLPALDHISTVDLSLFIQPDDARRFDTSGVYLPDLAITPGPSPTPDLTQTAMPDDATTQPDDVTPAPTPTLEATSSP